MPIMPGEIVSNRRQYTMDEMIFVESDGLKLAVTPQLGVPSGATQDDVGSARYERTLPHWLSFDSERDVAP